MIRVVVGGTVKDQYLETNLEGPFQMGMKYELSHALGEFFGGACTNIAVTLASMGVEDVRVCTKVGDDKIGEAALAYYKKHNIDTAYSVAPVGESGESTIVLSTTAKQRMIFVKRVTMEKEDIPKDLLSATGAEWVYMTSIGDAAQTVLDMIAAKPGINLTVIFGAKEIAQINEGTLRVPAAISDRPHAVLTINRDEWDMLTNHQDALRAAFTEVVVTDGGKGMRLDCDATGARATGGFETWLQVDARDSPLGVQDTSGAGDMSTAAYSYARSLGASRVISGRFAVLVSAMGIARTGAHTGSKDIGIIRTLSELEAFVEDKYNTFLVPRSKKTN